MRKLTLASALLLVGELLSASGGPSAVSAIVTSPEARASYLAHARIWKDPGDLSPQDVLEGPKGVFPYTYDQATTAGIDCTFAKPGHELGGTTPKFLCSTGSGRLLRLKYWEPYARDANREVFAVVAATRLLWALGFDALPALPMKVRCADCPRDPMTGKGDLGTREYLAELQAFPASGPWIRSDDEPGEGWSWRELDDATASLPPGPERVRQRTHFEALNLLGVFLQHGDRKPEQQALYCAGSIAPAAGEIRTGADAAPILAERPGGVACSEPAVMILDAGATFGGAGRSSNRVTAKMNLVEWRERSVFHEQDKDGTCHGRLVVSLAAKGNGESQPVITDPGRAFLLQQFARLSREHIRALFTAARVDHLGDRSSHGKSADTVIDEWVLAFQRKVDEIAATRCR